MRGTTLVEMLTTLAVAMLLMAVALPRLERLHDEGRVRGAAFHLAGRCGWLRMAAVHRGASVALRFTPTGTGWLAQSFLDGDWDGVRSADIAAGRDPALSSLLDVQGLFPGATFGFASGCPLTDGTSSAGVSPVRIGSARMLVFTTDGASSGGTLYLRGGPRSSGYAVVVLASTGRTRLLRCLPDTGVWVADGR
jgi:hypothetical protein